MKVAIPTYKRSELITQLSLNYLRRCGIKDQDIVLFTSNTQQAEEYRRLCGPLVNIIDKEFSNVRDKFNAIAKAFPPGERVLVMEDDISMIKKLTGYNKLEEELDLVKHATIAFNACDAAKTKLWGISSNSNPFFMKDGVAVGFKFIVANVFGFIAEEDPPMITCFSKTDYERTILYYKKYGNVVRLDYLCPITKNYTTKGGMQDEADQRYRIEEESVEYLTTTYPDLCQRNTKKESKYPEMLLKKPVATQGQDFSALDNWFS